MGLWDALVDLHRRHEALKKRIHNVRIPLSPGMRRVAMLFYFTAPIVGGYYIMQASNSIRDANLSGLEESARGTPEYAAAARQNEELDKVLRRAAGSPPPGRPAGG
mmetsp:Transcript_9394/g.32024  ORF Transcript_9394/g.32024 Transcript_9394/m.32024 type:complete len:106 (+) Transcript_9394:170-487(+)